MLTIIFPSNINPKSVLYQSKKRLPLTGFLLCYLSLIGFSQPNFVVIVSDDMGWTGSSVSMSPTISGSKSEFYFTPNLDRLAQDGMTFSQGYAAAPKCSPSRCSFLTGQTTARNGFTETGNGFTTGRTLIPASNTNAIDGADITIAEWLKSTNQNYRTAHFGKWHLGNNGPADHGFDFSDGNTTNDEGDNGGGAQADPKKIFDITTKGMDFMTNAKNEGTPFYLQLSHWAVHSVIEAKQETIDLYNDPNQRSTDPDGLHTDPAYAAMTEDMDTGIGQILDKITELGLGENTYVIFMSDNGGATGQTSNFPLSRGKIFLNEGGIRVPFIIKGPNIPAAVYSSTPIVSYDLFPTIAALVSPTTPLPADLDGVDISSLFSERALNREEPIYFHVPHYATPTAKVPVSAAIDGQYKLSVNYESGAIELFDLDNDIRERTDISTDFPEIRQNLWVNLRNHLKSVDANMPALDPTDPSFSGTAPDVDGDGLNDEWELRALLSYHFGPSDDPDGDGRNNLLEQTENTDPLVNTDGTTSLFSNPIPAAKISLFPNPTNGILHLALLGIDQTKDIQFYQVFDVNGQLLKKRKVRGHIIDLTRYSTGIYYINFQFENGMETHKVIRQ